MSAFSPRRYQHVYIAQRFDLLRAERVAQRAEVAHSQVIKVEEEDVVATPLLAALVVGVGPDARNENAPDLKFAGAFDDERFTLDRRDGIVVGVVVASGTIGLLPYCAEAELLRTDRL